MGRRCGPGAPSAPGRPAIVGAAVPDRDYERVRASGVAQPVNTVSSAAYAAAAASVLSAARRVRGPLRGDLLAYGVCLTGVAVGSVLFHGRAPGRSHRLHDVSLYLAIASGSRLALPVLTAAEAARDRRVLLALSGASMTAYLGGASGSPLCRPDSRLQLHAAWHVLSALVAAGVASASCRSPGRG